MEDKVGWTIIRIFNDFEESWREEHQHLSNLFPYDLVVEKNSENMIEYLKTKRTVNHYPEQLLIDSSLYRVSLHIKTWGDTDQVDAVFFGNLHGRERFSRKDRLLRNESIRWFQFVS